MKSVVALVASTWVLLQCGCHKKAETDRPLPGPVNHVVTRLNGVQASLSAVKERFDAGDRDWVKLVLRLQNEGAEKVTLTGAGAEHGWRWEFNLRSGGKVFIPRWDDDVAGCRAGPPDVVLEPGASMTVQTQFRQRSFALGRDFCSLVPGRYRVSAFYCPMSPPQDTQGTYRDELTAGTVEIEIAPRSPGFD